MLKAFVAALGVIVGLFFGVALVLSEHKGITEEHITAAMKMCKENGGVEVLL